MDDDPKNDLLCLVASALVRLSDQPGPGRPIYRHPVTQAYNMLVLEHLIAGIEPPNSVPDMVRLAMTPPAEWGLPDLTLDLPLVERDTRRPTSACYEWSVPLKNPLADRAERRWVQQAIQACKEYKSPESYTAFRRLLVDKPVLTTLDLEYERGLPEACPYRDLLPSYYEPAPASARGADGEYRTCMGCGCLLREGVPGTYICDLYQCRPPGHGAVKEKIPEHKRPLQLSAPLRTFVTGPGLVEKELKQRLAGFDFVMWPEFDTYDVRVEFSDRTYWAVDAKDRADPRRLALELTDPPRHPKWDRFYYVVPNERMESRRGYGTAFERNRPRGRGEQIRLRSVDEFIAEAEAYERGLTGA